MSTLGPFLPNMGSPELAQFGHQRYRPTWVGGFGLCRWEPLEPTPLMLDQRIKDRQSGERILTHDYAITMRLFIF